MEGGRLVMQRAKPLYSCGYEEPCDGYNELSESESQRENNGFPQFSPAFPLKLPVFAGIYHFGL
jgi:hypothetical protein